MICPKCKAEISDNSKFCTRCGSKIENIAPPVSASAQAAQEDGKCFRCGARLKAGARFCTRCGTEQTASAGAAPKMAAPTPAPAVNSKPAPAPAPVSNPTPAPAPVPVQTPASAPASGDARTSYLPPVSDQAPVKVGAKESASMSGQAPVNSAPKDVNATVLLNASEAASAPGGASAPASGNSFAPASGNSFAPASGNSFAPASGAAVQAASRKQKEPKKKSALPLILGLIVLFIALLAGGFFVLTKVLDGNPIEKMFSRDKEIDDTDDIDKANEGDREKEDSTDDKKDKDGLQANSDKEGDTHLAKPAGTELLNEVDPLVEEASGAYLNGAYPDAIAQAIDAIDRYVEIAEKNNLTAEAGKKINDALSIASTAAIGYGNVMKGQVVSSATYQQIINTVDPILDKAASLEAKGYTVDVTELKEYNEQLIPDFKEAYIEAINEITKREQWSRDEAWGYAEQAHKTQKDGKLVLFEENQPDDPLRLRYIYCLARISVKRCESMSSEDAFNATVAILEETDYNLISLRDAINYGKAAGKNVSKYQAAYNAIVEHIKKNQNLSILNTGVNSETCVDLEHFWYFNDLDGEDQYRVDPSNGTTKATREWIRNNIPSYFK